MASPSDEDGQSEERLIADAVKNLPVCFYEFRTRHPELTGLSLLKAFGNFLNWDGQNRVHVASEQGNLDSVMTQNPEYATQLNQQGSSAMHLASTNGQVGVVKMFCQHNPSLCFLRDKDGRLPVHVAIINGRVPVVRELMNACPESARELTAKLETALHLAVKWNQPNVIRFLLKKFRQLNQEELINWEDDQGNTALHLAIDRKQLETIELLLAGKRIGMTVQVNSKNKSGLTPLDLLGQSPSELGDREIGEILRSAGALKGCDIDRLRTTPPPPPRKQVRPHIRAKFGCMLPHITLETRNVTLVVFVFIASLMFAILSNPPSLLLGGHTQNSTYSIQEVIFGPSRPPSFFYMTLFSTTVFLMAMGVILVLMWPLPFRGILLFCFICFSISYGIILHKTMPEFTVICGSIHIPSLWFACFGFLALGFIGCMLNLILVSLCYICNKFNGPCADDPNILQMV